MAVPPATRPRLAVALALAAALYAGGAQGQGFSGHVEYAGGLGPVSAQRPLCLCVYTDAQLTDGLGCLILGTNPAAFQLTRNVGPAYYLIAFLDIHLNERLDPDEPYQIYQNRSAPPADPVSGTSGRTDIDFLFGDENLPAAPTATPTPSPSATAPPTPTSETLAGDCDGNGAISIDELVRAVTIALGVLEPSACPAADLDHDGEVHIQELIAVLNAALDARTAARAG